MKNKLKKVLATLLVSLGLVAIAATPANANVVYWNCTTGVACVWINSGGGGSKLTLAVGTYGYNTCWNFNSVWRDAISSASADFGGGWDLILFKDINCTGSSLTHYSPMSSSFTGLRAWFNDEASSFVITQA